MASLVVVDGYNVIYAIGAFRKRLDQSLESARDALIAYCRSYAASRRDVKRVIIVFDGNDSGSPAATSTAPVEVIFTRRREEADDRIIGLIREDAGRTAFIIVSDDNYVFNNSRAHGARVIPAAEFYKSSSPPKSASNPPSEKNISSADMKKINDEYKKHLGLE